MAGFQAQLPLVSEPTSSCPVAVVVVAEMTQSAVSPLPGCPHDTDENALTTLEVRLGPLAVVQSCGDWVRSAVHTAAGRCAGGVAGVDPMATQVVVVQERPVTVAAPVGKVDSLDQVLGPLAAMVAVRTVGSVGWWSHRRPGPGTGWPSGR